MRLRNRFLLVGLGIIIFLTATPILVLYARGFKYDFAAGKITKTGALVVRTEPTKAEVLLNDRLQKGATPLSIRFLLPDDYNVTVRKDGYQSWTKRLTVRSQLVTWVNNNREFIALFLQNPALLQTITSSDISLSSDGGQIGYVGADSSVDFINVDSGSIETSALPPIKMSPGFNARIEWQNGPDSLDFAKSFAANAQTLATLEKAQKIAGNGGYAAFEIGNDLYSLNSAGQISLIEHSILDFTLEDHDLWYIKNNTIHSLDLSNGQNQLIYDKLPAAAAGKIIRTSNKIYAILDNTLYVLNDSLQKIYSPVNFVHPAQDGTLVLGNGNELLTYHPNIGNTELILRSQTPITEAQLNIITGYIFFINEGKIKAIELDGRDHRNIYTLTDAGKTFTLDSNAENLYVLSDKDIKQYKIR